MRWMKCLIGLVFITTQLASEPKKPEVDRGEEIAFPEKMIYTKEEVQTLRGYLDSKSVELKQNSKLLKEEREEREKYLNSLAEQIDGRLAKIERARNEIAEFMAGRDKRENEKLKKLAEFYEAMPPEQAATLFKSVDDDLAIKILDLMAPKKVGLILAQMPPDRAAKITKTFSTLKLQVGNKIETQRTQQ